MFCTRRFVSAVVCLLATASVTMAATVISASDTILFDTTNLAYSINGGTPVAGVMQGVAARFDFAGLELQTGATVSITGSNPILIVSDGDIIVNSLIDVSGKSTVLGAAGFAGPGGGNGGGVRAVNPGSTTANGKGFGPSGGGSGWALDGTSGGSRAGGGGAYGGTGGINSRAYRSGGSADTYGGIAAAAYGTPQIYSLLGGSGGGGGKNFAGSGGGGGAIGLTTTSGNITIGTSGLIWSNGGDATTDFTGYAGTDYRYAGGGGSGGAIRLEAAGTVTITGSLSAKGGHGGCGMAVKTDCREHHGGGGAGGRIAIYTATGSYTGTVPATAVAGGDGGHLLVTLPSGSQTADGGPGAAGTINAYQGPMVLPGQATSPMPGDGETGVDIHNPTLSWHAGDSTATAWDVYFGTGIQSLQLLAHVTSASALAGELTVSTTYAWRVDEYNQYGTVTGAVWGFTSRGPACLSVPVGDANGDCHVDFVDAAIFVDNWLMCNRVPATECWQ
jgi:hypothetical protein